MQLIDLRDDRGGALKLTDLAAWWGAGVATLVLLWDIYKWRQSRARVTVTAVPNMERFAPHPADPNETVVVVEVVNVGNKKTTITRLFGARYSSWWQRLFRKSSKTLFVPQPLTAQILPFELEPGSRWVGAMKQTGELERWSREEYLMIGIHHSLANRACLRRMVIPGETKV